jgi:phage N-6-adenine-methyltransferase
MFSSNSAEWVTPPEVFIPLDVEFHFTLDVCATPSNTKVAKYFTEADDGLKQDWSKDVCWMNPPYGRVIIRWVKKAYEESRKGATVVCLLPGRTDTRWFHEYVLHKAKIRPVRGRITFLGEDGLPVRNKKTGEIQSAPFPSLIVIFRPDGSHGLE